jgi:hypothetical protein
MTKKYSVAILLPTRGRTDMLNRSVLSLVDNCADLSRVQLMFGFDRDDVVGLEHFKNNLKPVLDQRGVHYKAVQFKPMGYININRYGNELARHADADWFMFFNDDAIMTTLGWDQVIADRTGEFKLLAVHTHNDHPYSIFPIVPVKWMELLDHLSPHQMIDAWLSQCAYLLDIWERIEIYVDHDRHDLTGNNKDSTFKARVALEGKPHDPNDFHHPGWAQRRMLECEKISRYMLEIGLDIDWWTRVKSGNQDPWEKLKVNDINGQMVQYKMQIDPQRGELKYEYEKGSLEKALQQT